MGGRGSNLQEIRKSGERETETQRDTERERETNAEGMEGVNQQEDAWKEEGKVVFRFSFHKYVCRWCL